MLPYNLLKKLKFFDFKIEIRYIYLTYLSRITYLNIKLFIVLCYKFISLNSIFSNQQKKVSVAIKLQNERKSPNPLPQMFQVILDWTSDSSEINSKYYISNVSIVEDEKSKPAWSVFEKLSQVNLDFFTKIFLLFD